MYENHDTKDAEMLEELKGGSKAGVNFWARGI